MDKTGNPEDPLDAQRVPDENFRRLLKTIGEYPKPEEQALLGCTDCSGVTPHVVKRIGDIPTVTCLFCGKIITSKPEPPAVLISN
jgi:hypothetical protein